MIGTTGNRSSVNEGKGGPNKFHLIGKDRDKKELTLFDVLKKKKFDDATEFGGSVRFGSLLMWTLCFLAVS